MSHPRAVSHEVAPDKVHVQSPIIIVSGHDFNGVEKNMKMAQMARMFIEFKDTQNLVV